MKLLILFGLPAAGKTYFGKFLAKRLGYYFYDGDQNLPEEMRLAINNAESITDAMRDRFFISLLKTTIKLSQKQPKLIVAQTFIKEKYRQLFRDQFPQATWILVDTPQEIREKRLLERTESPLDLEYARQMVKKFETISFDHQIVDNQSDGSTNLVGQLDNQQFLRQ
jgi:gluconate kinase